MTRRSALAIAASAILGCTRHDVSKWSDGGATRVVSLAPSMTEALFAIGAGDRVVGRSRFCNYPPEAGAVPVVGGVEPDLEVVLELRPDLVVGIGGLSSMRLAERLNARGIATWFPETSSLAAVDNLIVGLGERTGRAGNAKRLAVALDSREDEIEQAVSGEPRPHVLMVVALAPVVAAGPKSFADELIHDAGGENAIVEGSAWPILGFEQMVDRDPDVVLDATLVGADRATHITPQAAGWRGLRAVREGRVVPIRDERVLRAGPRIAEGLAVLARALHPRAAVP
jgi:iron complex transport system substrate-binding protein